MTHRSEHVFDGMNALVEEKLTGFDFITVFAIDEIYGRRLLSCASSYTGFVARTVVRWLRKTFSSRIKSHGPTWSQVFLTKFEPFNPFPVVWEVSHVRLFVARWRAGPYRPIVGKPVKCDWRTWQTYGSCGFWQVCDYSLVISLESHLWTFFRMTGKGSLESNIWLIVWDR